MTHFTGVMKRNRTCDFCGGGVVGDNRLRKHEAACELVPPEIREKGMKAAKDWIDYRRNKKHAHKQWIDSGHIRGNVVCDLEGCGYEARGPQGLAKHKTSCITRTPDERTKLKPILEKYRRYGKTYERKKKSGARIYLPENDPLEMNELVNLFEGERTVRVTAKKIVPTPPPMFQEIGNTEVVVSADTQKLGALLTKVVPYLLPEILSVIKSMPDLWPEFMSLIKFERLERER